MRPVERRLPMHEADLRQARTSAPRSPQTPPHTHSPAKSTPAPPAAAAAPRKTMSPSQNSGTSAPRCSRRSPPPSRRAVATGRPAPPPACPPVGKPPPPPSPPPASGDARSRISITLGHGSAESHNRVIHRIPAEPRHPRLAAISQWLITAAVMPNNPIGSRHEGSA